MDPEHFSFCSNIDDGVNFIEPDCGPVKEFASISGNLTETQIDFNLGKNVKHKVPEILIGETLESENFLFNTDRISNKNKMNDLSADDFLSSAAINEENSLSSDEFSLQKIIDKDKILDISRSPIDLNSSIDIFKKEDSIDIDCSYNDAGSDEQFEVHSCDALMQVEVFSSTESADNDEEECNEKHNLYNAATFDSENLDCFYDKHEDSELSYVMNDHNYMSQELIYSKKYADPAHRTNELRRNLVNFVITDAIKEESHTNIEDCNAIFDFVDSILLTLNTFKISKRKSEQNLLNNTVEIEKVRHLDINDNEKKQRGVLDKNSSCNEPSTVLNFITLKTEPTLPEESVTYQIAQSEKTDKSHADNIVDQLKVQLEPQILENDIELATTISTSVGHLNQLSPEQGTCESFPQNILRYVNDQNIENVIPENFKVVPGSANAKLNKEQDDNIGTETLADDLKNKVVIEDFSCAQINFGKVEVAVSVASHPLTASEEILSSLPEDCSEPMEHGMNLETYLSDSSENLVQVEVIKQVSCFAETLLEDCKSFKYLEGNLDKSVQKFLAAKVAELKAITNVIHSIDTSVQTEEIISKRKLRKINAKDKKRLLESSDSSSTSNVSTDSMDSDSSVYTTELEKVCGEKALKKFVRSSSKCSVSPSCNLETVSRQSKDEKENSCVESDNISLNTHKFDSDFDDGVDISKYVQSEIFESEVGSFVAKSSENSIPEKKCDKENNGVKLLKINEETSAHENGNTSKEVMEKISEDSKSSQSYSESTTVLTTNCNMDEAIDTLDPSLTILDNVSAVCTSRTEANESDKENTSQDIETAPEDDKSKSDSTTFMKTITDEDLEEHNDKIRDKEIERLINFKGLTKKNKVSSSTNSNSSLDPEKARFKQQTVVKPSTLMEVLQEISRDSQTDESMSESDEEVITEKQFLARCNENLKQQLLNVSSDSECAVDENEELQDILNGEDLTDEDGHNSPLVDKFLKTFNAEDIENEEEDAKSDMFDEKEFSTLMPNNEAVIKANDNETKAPLLCGIKTNETTDIKDKKSDNSAIHNTADHDIETGKSSDCEFLSEGLKKKHNKPKSLEKLLLDADKRKKIAKIDEDTISLSSDSDSSDVEECALEAPEEQKQRLLKPMLRQDQLAGETRKAQKQESDRIRRLEKKTALLAKVIKEKAKLSNEKDPYELILDYNSETKTFIKVHPDIVKHLKPHQVDGVKFIYDSCYGGVDTLKKSGGSGCILAHCMGLGKTLQLIALLHTVITYKELKTSKVLVLCPKSTVMNWADEIYRWLGPLSTKNLRVFSFNDVSDINEKLSVLREWSLSSTRAGCLLIGYEAFRTLVFYHNYKNRGNLTKSRLEDIKEKVYTYLLKPGADLVVCDEGHIIKNRKSAISLAVAGIVTPRRIVLTGTPIQNNLKEYYSMVNFIKPLFLGTEKEFANLYANPIKNGQHKDSSKRDIKVMKQRSFVLHKKLSKFVQRKEAELLKTFLPQKFEYVLFIPMTPVQNNLYEFILAAISKREDNRGKSLITDYTCLRKIWTHPKVLEDAWRNAIKARNKKDVRRNISNTPHSDDDQPDDVLDSQTGVMSVTRDWWRNLLSEKDLETIYPSNKLRTMFEIFRICEENGEKCLVFSAFVAVLNVVEFFLKKINDRDPETLRETNININNGNEKRSIWVVGQDYYRLDGKTPKSIRHEMVKRFNNPSNKRARVFLISAKAGGQGINLTGANRVIILDTSWNPSNDQQNIFRIFRLGQRRNCYIYRLLAMGTMEEKVYSRSVTKQAMSFRVVDEQQIDRHYSMAELAELYTLTKPNYAERPMPIFPQDNILANLLLNYPDLVYKYHEHDSLLENKVEQELSEQEKADAWAAYERDLQLSSEIKEMPANFEGIPNTFPHIQAQNYLASMAGGFDTRNFSLGYGLGQQGMGGNTLAQSLLSNYNYSTSSQAYLDMINMYRNFSPSLMYGMNQNTGLTPYSSGYGMPQGSGVIGNPPLPNLMPANTNPLSALGSLTTFGLSGIDNGRSSSANNSSFSPSMFSSSSPSYTPASASALNSASEQIATYEQYKRTLENFGNLSNFTTSPADFTKRRDFSQAVTPPRSPMPKQTTNIPSLPVSSHNSHPQTLAIAKLSNTTTSLPPPQSSPVTVTLPASLQTIPIAPTAVSCANVARNIAVDSIPISVIKKGEVTNKQLSPLANTQTTSRNSPLSHLKLTKTSEITSPSTTVPSNTSSLMLADIADTRASNMGILYPGSKIISKTSPPTLNPSPGNIGIVYPKDTAVGLQTKSKINTSPPTLCKSGSGMQIIQTRGKSTSDIVTKQFDQISPSISLTAVNSNQRNQRTTPNQQSNTSTITNANSRAQPMSSSVSTITTTTSATLSKVQPSAKIIQSQMTLKNAVAPPKAISSNSAISSMITKKHSTPSPSSVILSPSTTPATVSLVSTKAIQKPTETSSSLTRITRISDNQPTRLTKVISTKPTSVALSPLPVTAKSTTTTPSYRSTQMHIKGNQNIVSNKLSSLLTTVRKPQKPSETSNLNTSKIAAQIVSKQLPGIIANTTVTSVANSLKRNSPISISAVQQKSRQYNTNSTTKDNSATKLVTKRIELNANNLAAVKNSINLRPVENKPTGSGVFIIETNATKSTGAPASNAATKSGGATITRLPLQRKRVATSPMVVQNDYGVTVTEVKRQKLSIAQNAQTTTKLSNTISESLRRVQSSNSLTIVPSSSLQKHKVVNKAKPTEVVEIQD